MARTARKKVAIKDEGVVISDDADSVDFTGSGVTGTAADGKNVTENVPGATPFTSPLTTKGDIYGRSTADARIPIGSDAQVLTADSTQTLGLKWATPAAVPSGANPSASVGLTAVNGSASTFLRSDGAPALSQSIVPTWTGQHTFSTSRPIFSNVGKQFNYLAAPTAPSVALAGAGAGNVENGTHYYWVSYTTAEGETSLTPASGGSSVNVTVVDLTTNGKVTVTVPLGGTNVTGRKIYRGTAGNNSAALLLTTINDNSTTSYTDNTADASLGQRAIDVVNNPNGGGNIQQNTTAGTMWLNGSNKITVDGDTGRMQFNSVGAGFDFIQSTVRAFRIFNSANFTTDGAGTAGEYATMYYAGNILYVGHQTFNVGGTSREVRLMSGGNSSLYLSLFRGQSAPKGWFDFNEGGTSIVGITFTRFQQDSWTGSNNGTNVLAQFSHPGIAMGGNGSGFTLLDVATTTTSSGAAVKKLVSVMNNTENNFIINDLGQTGFGIGQKLSQFTIRPRPDTDTFTAVAATDVCTNALLYLLNGTQVTVSNSGGALPTGLSANTTYYVISTSALTYKLSATLGGSAIDITGAGTGTHTIKVGVRGTGVTNASTTIATTGGGTGNLGSFLQEVGIGDRIAASSAPTVYGTVTAIASNTSLTSDTALGDGTTQSYTVKRSIARWENASGTTKLVMNDLGYIGLGVTNPSSYLHIAAGTATAGTAPLKLTSGTNLTAAEAGAIEYDGTELYFSPSTTRRKLGIVTAGSSTMASGVYTPTRSAEANMDANVTMFEAQYMQVGNTVTVSGRFTADPTLAATATSFEMTLPVASNIGAVEDCSGTANCGTVAGMGAAIEGVAANDTMKVKWVSSDITSQSWSFTATYQVI